MPVGWMPSRQRSVNVSASRVNPRPPIIGVVSVGLTVGVAVLGTWPVAVGVRVAADVAMGVSVAPDVGVRVAVGVIAPRTARLNCPPAEIWFTPLSPLTGAGATRD